MYSNDRGEIRQVFFRAWRNYRAQRPLEGVERVIVDVAQRHPEYHALLEAPDTAAQRDYLAGLGETNPFMHLGLHIAIEEQLAIDQPAGVRQIYRQLLARHADAHTVEHAMMECLAETLWQAERNGQTPDQNAYIDCLRRLAQKS
ncbi:MAG: DUF1841 family protein [Gammaproteobacteria bacterium]|nr:DUF1841 family protein [Gammaproteobacteria bacterium]